MSEPSSSPNKSAEDEEDDDMRAIRKFFADKLHLCRGTSEDGEVSDKVMKDLTFDGLINHWQECGFKKVVTMVGAGISTSAGIPDFRTPGTGLYENLQKYNLPYPEAIFDLDFFNINHRPFFNLAKELYPGTFKPTPSHYFVRLLHDKGLLLRHYSQNIDTLDRIAGVPEEKLVEAHGTFHTNHCLRCATEYSREWMKEKIFNDEDPLCTKCKSLVKPDIVFFGENLPRKFYTFPAKDFAECDLLIIMGTSLEVHPFASLIERPGRRCVRLLINREKVGVQHSRKRYTDGSGLLLDHPKNTRDVAYIGNCDDGAMELAEGLGWGDELRELIANEHARLDELERQAAQVKTDSNKSDNDEDENASKEKSCDKLSSKKA